MENKSFKNLSANNWPSSILQSLVATTAIYLFCLFVLQLVGFSEGAVLGKIVDLSFNTIVGNSNGNARFRGNNMSPDKALFDNIYSFTIFNNEIIISDNDRLRKYNNITNKVTTIAGGGYSNNYIENTDATKTRLSAKRVNIRYNYNHENQELYISIASEEYVGIIKTNNTGNLFEKTDITSNSYGYEGPFHIDTNGDMYFVPPYASNCLMFYQNSSNQINWLFCDDDFSYGNIYSIVMGENHQLYYAISDVRRKLGFIKQFLFEENSIPVIVGYYSGYNGDATGLFTGICPLGLQYDFKSKVFYFTDIIGDTNIIRKYDTQTDKVTTLAGYPGFNSVDDGVPANIVKINYPRDVFYYNGEIYFSDNDSKFGSRIRKITKDGLVYTVVGSYSVDYVGMEAPDINCMAMVGAIYKNNYYFIDSARNDGSLMRVNSTSNKVEEEISKTGIDKDIPNLIVVKDKFYYANKTSIISYDMVNLHYWTFTPLTLVANIKGFTFDFLTEEIYVSECGKNGSDIYHSRISKITTDGNYVTVANLDNDRCAISMIVNGSNIYYIETSFSQNGINSTIVKLGIDGSKKLVIAGEGNSDNDYILAKDTKLYGPTSLVMTLREEIMFVEPSKNRIRKIKKDGKVLTLTMTGNELHNPNWIGLYDNNLLLTNQVEFYVSDITLRCYGIKVTNSSVCGGKGFCSDYDKCDCFEGYFGKECTIPQCNGILSNETGVCSGHGDCLAYNQCKCKAGYIGINCEIPNCFNFFSNDTANVCNGHGSCDGIDICRCKDGYFGSKCEVPSCFSILANNTQNVCSGKGNCLDLDKCKCIDGYFGANCSIPSCFNILGNDTSNVCNGLGECVTLDKCKCVDGYYGSNCSIPRCFSVLGNDTATVCSGNGTCTSLDHCKCNDGYFGKNCEIPSCNFILANETQNVCNGNGNCVSHDNCKCKDEYSGNLCEIHSCYSILSTQSNVCSNHGKCLSLNNCNCTQGYTGANCEIPICFNILANDTTNVCNGHGSCNGIDICKCKDGYFGSKCEIPSCFTILANDTQNVCSNHGICVAIDQCTCTTGWKGNSNCSIISCDGVNNCSDHGVCIDSNQCSCSSGWKGDSSCSKVSCENQNSCSGHGTCTGPNQCTCQSGWKQSSDCSTISCEELGNCNDKGICVSSNVCQCISGYRGSNDCKQFSCDGVNNCTNGRGSCIGPNKCHCPIEYTGNDCGTLVYNCYGKLGNDSTACSGNGLCIGIDSCKCNSDVYGLQCDFIPEIKYSTKVSKYSTILFTTNIKSFNLNNNNFSYKWSQISGTNTLDLNTISIAGTDKIDFGIKANDNNVIQGETYGLQLNITRSEIVNGQLTVVSLPVSFTINKSPIINNYNLLDASTNNPIQSSVVAGETNIKAIITNAQDAEGKAIEYAFGYFTSTNERVYLSYFSQSKNSATFKLPLFISGKAKVFLTIRDELLDTDEKIVELTVTDPTANLNDNQLNNYIQNLVNNNTNSNGGNIPIEQLDIATSLLNKPISNPNDPNIKQQREELRNTIVNSLVASYSSQNDTSTVLNILSSVTQNTQELKLETAITALQLILNITANNNQQQQQDKIVALTSQLINSVLTTTGSSSTNMQVCEAIKNILDSISKSTVQSLISGQSQLIQTNNIKTYLVKDTVDSLAKSLNTTVISQLGISNLNLPIDALKTLFKNNGIDIANPVALGVNVVPNSIYNYLGQNITSPIFRINLFLNDGTSLNITNLLVPIEFEMTIISSVTGNNKCWYYNEKVKALRLDGVETVVINSNRVKCRVYHLTDFTTAPQIVSPSLSVAKSTRVISSTSKVHVSGANINVMSWLIIILCSLISVL